MGSLWRFSSIISTVLSLAALVSYVGHLASLTSVEFGGFCIPIEFGFGIDSLKV